MPFARPGAQAGQAELARVAYADALLYEGALEPGHHFEVLNNRVAAMVSCDQLFPGRDAAYELTETFPHRTHAWLGLAYALNELERRTSEDEGFADRAARRSRKATAKELARCVEMARKATDAHRYEPEIEKMALFSEMKVSKKEAARRELWCRAMRIRKSVRESEHEDEPRAFALGADLCTQSGETAAALVQRACCNIDAATSLMAPLEESGADMPALARCTVHADSALLTSTLLALLAERMPAIASRGLVAAAAVSRGWRVAAVTVLQSRALDDFTRAAEIDGMSDAAERCVLRFQRLSALVVLGRFDEAREAGRALWRDRLEDEYGHLATFDHTTFESVGGGKVVSTRSQAFLASESSGRFIGGWEVWASLLDNGLRLGALINGSGDVDALAKGFRADIAEAILWYAERLRERGSMPRALSKLVATAEAVCGECEVPQTLRHAISGWAGARGDGLSGEQLDNLWDSLLSDARAARQSNPPDPDVVSSHLDGLTIHDAQAPPRAVRMPASRPRPPLVPPPREAMPPR